MKITLAPYEKRSINSSGGYFTVLKVSVSDVIELSATGIEDIPLETTDQINIGDSKKVTLQNLSGDEVEIEYNIASTMVARKGQVTKAEITNTTPIKVEMDKDVNIGAVNQDGDWTVFTDSAANANTHKPRVNCVKNQATKLFDSRKRKSVRLNIRADQLNGVTLGNDNTINDNSGGYLDVGMVDYIETKGELWVFNAGDADVLVDVLELV